MSRRFMMTRTAGNCTDTEGEITFYVDGAEILTLDQDGFTLPPGPKVGRHAITSGDYSRIFQALIKWAGATEEVGKTTAPMAGPNKIDAAQEEHGLQNLTPYHFTPAALQILLCDPRWDGIWERHPDCPLAHYKRGYLDHFDPRPYEEEETQPTLKNPPVIPKPEEEPLPEATQTLITPPPSEPEEGD